MCALPRSVPIPRHFSRPGPFGQLVLACLSFAGLGCSSANEPASSTLEGNLAVYESSFKNGSVRIDYALSRADLPEVKLEFARPPNYAPGTRVEVVGSFAEGGEFIASSVDRVSNTSPVAHATQALTQATQTRSIAVLLLRPSTEPEPPPWVISKALVENNLFGTETLPDFPAKARNVNDYFKEVSYGARAFQGTVFNWLTIDPLADYCDTDAVRNAALAKASQSGIDLSSFQHVGMVIAASCSSIAGRGDLGTPNAPGRYTWYYYEADSEIFIHELGHNFGMQHSLLYQCTTATGEPAPISTTDHCTENPAYPQDPWDPMGLRSFAHYGAYNKILQGWLAGPNVVTPGPSGGDFTLEPLEIGTNAPQVLRIPVDTSVCPADIRPCYYYVEYRQPIGFDDSPEFNTTGTHAGATIRLGGAIDSTGNSAGSLTRFVLIDAPLADALRVGETFQDPTGLRIMPLSTPNSGGHQQLVVRVSRASRVNATFVVSSGQSGATGSYCGEVKITNISSTPVNGGWLVRLNLEQSQLTSSWNATFNALGSSRYDVTPVAWNSVIQPGQTITVGLCANKTGPNFTPQVEFTQSN